MMSVRDLERIKKFLPPALRRRLPPRISLIRISEEYSRNLNRRYRKKDRATNVLSFRYEDGEGEILLCVPVIRREAKRADSLLRYQMTWMILHAMLHLAGMHHEKSRAAARRFERKEDEILQRLLTPGNYAD